jgi:pimeloyl-ACP methyl ester carboxylesterase
MWTALSILLLLVFGVLTLLLVWSHPGRPQPFVDQDGKPLPGSISQKTHVEINGAMQGMIIKSRDAAAPVLLYLHGGMPDYFLSDCYPTGLENHFTMCWWEQRGAGLSYSPVSRAGAISVEQLISDTLELTNYLRDRFGRRAIYLMGHSGGTFIGIQAVASAPELYSAYIGVAQMSNQLKSEKLAYDYMLRRLQEEGKTRLARKLLAAPVTMTRGTPRNYLSVRDAAMHTLGVGTTRDMRSVLIGIFLRSLQCRDYTLREKFNLWRGKASSGVSVVWETMLSTDLSDRVPRIERPAYFLHGRHDYTCSYTVARGYFDKLSAPVKGFYTFDESAHSPLFEEPERTRTIMRTDVLAGVTGLADRP